MAYEYINMKYIHREYPNHLSLQTNFDIHIVANNRFQFATSKPPTFNLTSFAPEHKKKLNYRIRKYIQIQIAE